MSRANPRKAMAALLPLPITVCEGKDGEVYTIRPMTLAMYAALERIGSPLVTGVDAKDMIELIPSAYLLTHGAKEIFRGNLLDLAMTWADTVPVDTLVKIRDACRRQIDAVKDVIPQGEMPKKKLTGGSATSPSGSARHSTGLSAKRSTRSRSRQSSSSSARKA